MNREEKVEREVGKKCWYRRFNVETRQLIPISQKGKLKGEIEEDNAGVITTPIRQSNTSRESFQFLFRYYR